MANPVVAPPRLEPAEYERWRKEMAFWELATNVPDKKRAATIFLTLSGKAREAILEMDPTTLNVDGGLTLIYGKLDKMFKVDQDQAALNAYEKFEKFTRPSSMSLTDFKVEFDRLVHQLKTHKIVLPEPVLAYRALKSANLSYENEKLVRATVPAVKLDDMMIQLSKVVGVQKSSEPEDDFSGIRVKQEPNVNYSEGSKECSSSLDQQDDVCYNRSQFGGTQKYQAGRRSKFSGRRAEGRGRYRGAPRNSHS